MATLLKKFEYWSKVLDTARIANGMLCVDSMSFLVSFFFEDCSRLSLPIRRLCNPRRPFQVHQPFTFKLIDYGFILECFADYTLPMLFIDYVFQIYVTTSHVVLLLHKKNANCDVGSRVMAK